MGQLVEQALSESERAILVPAGSACSLPQRECKESSARMRLRIETRCVSAN